jgi:glutamine cyclotransferase
MDFGTTNVDEILNGIAYNPITQQLLLTGKMWHFLYEVAIL